MSKIGIIIKREYFTRVKKKSFIIMTIVGPLLFAGLMIGGIYLATLDTKKQDVLIVDEEGLITKRVDKDFMPKHAYFENTPGGQLTYSFTNKMLSDDEFKESPYTIMIDLDLELFNAKKKFWLTFKDVPSALVKDDMRDELDKAIEHWRVDQKENLTYTEYKDIKVNVGFQERDIEKLGEEVNSEGKGIVGFVFSFVIYIFIFMYGVMVMRGVIEEKTSRIVEVIVSSVKPFELMLGKVIGIGLVGLTQFVMWVILGSIFSLIAMPMITGYITDADAINMATSEVLGNPEMVSKITEVQEFLLSVPWTMLIGVFIFAFIGGFLLYGAIFAAIGSAVDSETETQQFMLPITIPLIFGFLIAEMMIINPGSAAGVWGSFIPLTSPIVMMVRTAIEGEAILWQMVLSIVLLLATALLVIWLAGKIYRTGILMYGKKASFKELLKWIRYSN